MENKIGKRKSRVEIKGENFLFRLLITKIYLNNPCVNFKTKYLPFLQIDRSPNQDLLQDKRIYSLEYLQKLRHYNLAKKNKMKPKYLVYVLPENLQRIGFSQYVENPLLDCFVGELSDEQYLKIKFYKFKKNKMTQGLHAYTDLLDMSLSDDLIL